VLLLRTCVLIGTLSTTAMAQAQEPASINYGGFRITPVVNTELAYVDNVTYVRDPESIIESYRLTVAPQVEFYTENNFSRQRLVYRLENAQYYSSSEDNYTDHFLNYSASAFFTDTQSVLLRVSLEEGHEARGQGFTAGRADILTSTDNFTDIFISGEYMLGSSRSTIFATGLLSYRDLDYDLDITPLFNRDREELSAGLSAKYRFSPFARIALDIERDDIQYAADSTNFTTLDSTRDSILIGVDWDASAFLSGTAQIGYEERDFVSPQRKDFYGVDWYVDVTWQPTSIMSLTLLSDFDTRENNALGDFIDTTNSRLVWKQKWLERLQSTVGLGYARQEFQGLDPTIEYREDSTTSVNFAVDYQFRRWLNFTTFYNYSTRSSNLLSIDFNRRVLGLTIKVTL
jgi:hypothetical protein